jgi:hypothetical protein
MARLAVAAVLLLATVAHVQGQCTPTQSTERAQACVCVCLCERESECVCVCACVCSCTNGPRWLCVCVCLVVCSCQQLHPELRRQCVSSRGRRAHIVCVHSRRRLAAGVGRYDITCAFKSNGANYVSTLGSNDGEGRSPTPGKARQRVTGSQRCALSVTVCRRCDLIRILRLVSPTGHLQRAGPPVGAWRGFQALASVVVGRRIERCRYCKNRATDYPSAGCQGDYKDDGGSWSIGAWVHGFRQASE